MNTLSGKIASGIWKSTPKALKIHHSVIWTTGSKNTEFQISGIWKPIVNTLKIYPLDNQKLLKLSGLSAQVPDAFKKRISTPRRRKSGKTLYTPTHTQKT